MQCTVDHHHHTFHLSPITHHPNAQEEECVENLFDALAAALLVPDNQQRFRQGVV